MKKRCDICGLEYTQNNYLGRFRTAECPAIKLLLHVKDVNYYYSDAMKELWIPRIEAHGGVVG